MTASSSRRSRSLLLTIALLAGALMATATAGPAAGASPRSESVAEHWTPQRMANAIPRDLVIDGRGLGYLRMPDGTLEPYGHDVPAKSGGALATPTPNAKPNNPGGSTDATAPVIDNLDPSGGVTIPTSYTFAADVSDPESGIKSVTFHVTHGGTTQSYSASTANGLTYTVALSGLNGGAGSWYVEATNGAKKGGLTDTSGTATFTVDAGTSGGGGGDTGTVVTNAEWTFDGAVQTAAGRLYFEMPYRGPFWAGYICSGTVATDAATGRSIIITAAHCVYDEANDVFARNVMFIPNQADTVTLGGTETDTNCNNDPLGCWAPSHGVVDNDWAQGSWPDIIPWDFGYYVVPTSNAHSGTTTTSDSLEEEAGSLPVNFATDPGLGSMTYALGYSGSEDPKFMYCAEGLGVDSSYGTHWLSQCGLSGGSSGGPWINPMSTNSTTGAPTGSGEIVAVNSYGYSNQPGMGAAHLTGGTAKCAFDLAHTVGTTQERGAVVNC